MKTKDIYKIIEVREGSHLYYQVSHNDEILGIHYPLGGCDQHMYSSVKKAEEAVKEDQEECQARTLEKKAADLLHADDYRKVVKVYE